MKQYSALDDTELENESICPACVTTAPLCFCTTSCQRCGLPFIPDAYQGAHTKLCECYKKHELTVQSATKSSGNYWLFALAVVGALALIIALTAMANLPLK